MRMICSTLAAGALLCAGGAVAVHAQTFAVQVGPPVAAMPGATSGPPEKKVGKDVVFVWRSSGCPEPANVRFTGTAEALVAGVRRTWSLPMGPLVSGSVFGVVKNWTEKAPWVAVVSATCGSQEAGALVRIVNDTYRREGVELVARHPTAADIERALALLAKDEAAPPR